MKKNIMIIVFLFIAVFIFSDARKDLTRLKIENPEAYQLLKNKAAQEFPEDAYMIWAAMTQQLICAETFMKMVYMQDFDLYNFYGSVEPWIDDREINEHIQSWLESDFCNWDFLLIPTDWVMTLDEYFKHQR